MTADHHHHTHDDDGDGFEMPPILGFLDTANITGIQVIGEGELAAIIGPDMLDHLMGMLGRSVARVYTPKRGTEDYRTMLDEGARATDLEGLTSGISHLWTSYRWPGVVDYMEVLIRRIVASPQPLIQDSKGRPQLDLILSTSQTEEDLMETAVAVSNEPYAQEQGFDFMGALEIGKELVRNMDEWRPVYQEAINLCADGEPEMVRPTLVKLPGLREDRDRVVQGVLVLALACIAVSNPLAALRNCMEYDTPAGELAPVHRRAKGRNRHN